MTDQLPFVHPADEPSAATMQRAFSKVEHSVRRRRAQRRALLAAPAATLVVVAAVGTFTVWRGDRGGDVVAQSKQSPDLDVDPNTDWMEATLSKDGRTLTIQVANGPEPCRHEFEHDVVETATSVTVGIEELPLAPVAEERVCSDMLEPTTIEVALDEPLGTREAFDGVHAQPQPVHRLGDLVDVTDVPEGWTSDVAVTTEHGWQQTFQKDGEDWYFAVNQQPTDEATTPEGTPSPVTVHGIQGTRYSGQMNNTMESIRWVEDGLTITVWGEMQGPPSYTHHDELLQIAEGVRLPR